jgi:hypothetical protein
VSIGTKKDKTEKEQRKPETLKLEGRESAGEVATICN